jgi:tetratricopeptide (TPR) repeat protein
LELNPNRASVMACLGGFYGFNGMVERALEYMDRAKFLDPLFRPNWHCRMDGVVQFVARRHSEAIAAFGRSMPLPFWGHAYIAACSALLSRRDDADRHATEVLRLKPDFSLSRFAAREPYRRQADRSHLVEALGIAGLPD